MPWCWACKGSWQCSTDAGKETRQPRQCAAWDRQGTLGTWTRRVWNKSDIRLRTTANVYDTVVITLLHAWKEGAIYSCHGKRSGQFFMQCLQVLAGTEGHGETSTVEILEYCQNLLCSSEKQLTASSKTSLMAHSDRVKSWKTLNKRYQPLLKADRQPWGTTLTTLAETADTLSCPRLRGVTIWCSMNSDTGKQA